MDSRIIQLTSASLKYGNLNIRNCGLDFFPQGILGGATRDTAETKIIIHPLGFSNEIETDIPTDSRTGKPRWIFRERAWVKQFIRTNRLTSNAKVIITRLSEERYLIAPAERTYTQQLFSAYLSPNQMRKSSDSMNSPFRYAGGKFYARKLILQHIPFHKNYCEPFAGGASIFFAKPKAVQSHLNDLDEELMRVYRIIRDQPEDLISFLSGKPAAKELHAYYKNVFQPKTSLEKAARWYYLNRTSYSGIMNIQNCYWGYGDKFSKRPENWSFTIRQASKKLQGVKLTNYSFERAIEESEDGTFLFVDLLISMQTKTSFIRALFPERTIIVSRNYFTDIETVFYSSSLMMIVRKSGIYILGQRVHIIKNGIIVSTGPTTRKMEHVERGKDTKAKNYSFLTMSFEDGIYPRQHIALSPNVRVSLL